ncbi:MAG: replicative DNA helicase [Christensenellales bacterium]
MAKTNDNNTKQLAQIMPSNTEAELGVLGSALISEDACVGIMGKLKPTDFYSEVNQKVFEAMCNLYKRNVVVDYITLTDELEHMNMLNGVGGAEFIMSLTNVVPSSARWTQYVDIVKRCATNRRLIGICDRVTRKAYNGDEDSLNEAEKGVFELAESGQVSDLEHINPYLDVVMSKFETINKNGGQLQGVPSGFYAIDEITRGWQNSDLIVIAARPAVGKTALSMNFIVNAALKKYKCAVFSLEMSKSQLTQRMICSVAGVDMSKALCGKLSSADWTKLFNALNTLKECEIYIDDSTLNTPAEILSKCRKLKREKGLDLIMIDYLQLMYSDKKSDNRQSEVADISRRMKILAKELNVPVLLLSQLNRSVETRKGKPVLSDLRETGAIEQDADIVMFIHKPEEMKGVEHEDAPSDYTAEIIFAKHRSGKVGSVYIGWKGSRVSFVNLPKDGDMQSLMEGAPPEPKRIKGPEKIESGDFNDIFVDEANLPPFDVEYSGDGSPLPEDEPDFPSEEEAPPVQKLDDPNGDIFE